MDWIEADPLPAACLDCREEECYNCDTAGERWQLSSEDELRVRRKQLAKAIERLQHKIDAIDMELLPFTGEQRAALDGNAEMIMICFGSACRFALIMTIWGCIVTFGRPIPIIQKTSDGIWKCRFNSAIIGLRVYIPAIFSKVRIWDFGTLRMILWETFL